MPRAGATRPHHATLTESMTRHLATGGIVDIFEGESVGLAYFTVDGGVESRFGLITGERVIDLARSGGPASLTAALQMSAAELQAVLRGAEAAPDAGLPLDSVALTAPIDRQEVWAAG